MSIFSRLFGGVGRDVAKIRDAEGFRPATEEELFGEHAELWRLARNAHKSTELVVEFIEKAEVAIVNQAVLPHGIRVAAVVSDWPYTFETALNDSMREDYAQPFLEAHRRKNTPLSAAIYANVCHFLAFNARGTNWSHKVSDKQWALMAKWNESAMDALAPFKEGYDALEDHDPQLNQYHSWSVMMLRLLASVCGSDLNSLLRAYNVYSRPYRADLFSMALVAHFLMPRWSNVDLGALDEFARLCMEKTESEYGRGAYAYVYSVLVANDPVDESICDRELLEAGWNDLSARFPCVHIQNAQMASLFWADLNAQAWQIVAKDLRAIDKNVWQEEQEKTAVAEVVKIYRHLKQEYGNSVSVCGCFEAMKA